MRFLLVPLVVILLAMIPKSAEAQSDRFMTDDTLPGFIFHGVQVTWVED